MMALLGSTVKRRHGLVDGDCQGARWWRSELVSQIAVMEPMKREAAW